MSDTPKKTVVEEWLEEEEALAPECRVVAAVRVSTREDVLDEAALLKKVRGFSAPQATE